MINHQDRKQKQKRHIRRHFDRHAAEYDLVSEPQIKMAAVLMMEWQKLTQAHTQTVGDQQLRDGRILELGSGTGHFTTNLLQQTPAKITAIDISPKMVSTLQQKLSGDRLSCICADAEEWLAEQQLSMNTVKEEHLWDAIVSNAAMQWFAAPETALLHMHNLLKPGGWLVIGTYGPRTLYELQSALAEAERQLGETPVPHAPVFPAESWWRNQLQHAANMQIIKSDDCMWLRTPRDVMHQVRRMGAANKTSERYVPRAVFQRAEEIYQADYARQQDGWVPATFERYLVFFQKRQ